MNSWTAVAMLPVVSTTEISLLPVLGAASNTFARTLTTAGPEIATVCIAFPEYTGEVSWF